MKKYSLKTKKAESMPYEREEVFVKKTKIGEIGTALACGPFGNENWRYCYRPINETTFDWKKGFMFYGGPNFKMKKEAKEKAINALIGE